MEQDGNEKNAQSRGYVVTLQIWSHLSDLSLSFMMELKDCVVEL